MKSGQAAENSSQQSTENFNQAESPIKVSVVSAATAPGSAIATQTVTPSLTLALLGFLLLNCLGLYTISSFAAYQSVTQELRESFVVFFVAAAALVTLFVNQTFWQAVLQELRNGKIICHGLQALLIVHLIGWNVYGLVTNYDSYVIGNQGVNFVFSLFAINLIGLALVQARRYLRDRTSLQLSKLVRQVTAVDSGDLDASTTTARKKPLADVRIADLLLFKKGDLLPVDGTVVAGSAELIERRLSLSVERAQKGASSSVWAGSEVLHGHLIVSVTALPQEAMITNFVANINRDNEQQLKDSETAESYQSLAAWGLVFLSLFALVFWSRQSADLASIQLITGSMLAAGIFLSVFELLDLAIPCLRLKLFELGLYLPGQKNMERFANVNYLLECNASGSLPCQTNWKLEVLDDRIERRSLAALVYAITSAIAEEEYKSLLRASADWKRAETQPVLENILYYKDQGCIVSMSGVECSLGIEAFLIARGIHMNPAVNDAALPEDLRPLYLALDDVVVATITPMIEFAAEQKITAELRKSGLQVAYRTIASQEEADRQGKVLGYELTEISQATEVNREFFAAGLPASGLCFISDARIARRSKDMNADLATVSFFDEYLWDVGSSSATVFKSSRRDFIESLLSLQRNYRLQEKLNLFCWGLLVAMLCASFFGRFSVEVILLLEVIALSVCFALLANKFCFKMPVATNKII